MGDAAEGLEARVRGPRPPNVSVCRSPGAPAEVQAVAQEGWGRRGPCTRVFETKGRRQLGARRLQRGPTKAQADISFVLGTRSRTLCCQATRSENQSTDFHTSQAGRGPGHAGRCCEPTPASVSLRGARASRSGAGPGPWRPPPHGQRLSQLASVWGGVSGSVGTETTPLPSTFKAVL